MKADYGIDAPGVIRNLLLVAAAGLVAAVAKAAGWSGIVALGGVRLNLAPMLIWPGLGCAAMALWMLYDSKIGKVRDRERLLDHVVWSGSEHGLTVRRSGSRIASAFFAIVTFGALRPATLPATR